MAEELNASQIKLVCAVLTNFTPKVDWEAVNAITQHANAASARRQWDNLRAKKGWGGGIAGKGKGGDPASASKPKSARKRKNTTQNEDAAEDDTEGVESLNAAKKASKGVKDMVNGVKPEPVDA